MSSRNEIPIALTIVVSLLLFITSYYMDGADKSVATVDKKGRKLKKSEEKQIEKIVGLLEENPDAILWVEMLIFKLISQRQMKEGKDFDMESFKEEIVESFKASKKK